MSNINFLVSRNSSHSNKKVSKDYKEDEEEKSFSFLYLLFRKS